MQGILGLSDSGDHCREGGPRVEAIFDVDGARLRLSSRFCGERPCCGMHDCLLPRRKARATESCTRSRDMIASCFEHESHAGAAYSREGRTRLRKKRVTRLSEE